MALSTEEEQLLAALLKGYNVAPPVPVAGAADPSTGRQRARAGLQGITGGSGDEIVAAGGAVLAAIGGANYGEAYRDIRDAERAEQTQYGTAYPVENMALQAGGTLLGGAGALSAASRIPGAVKAAQGLSPAARVLGGGALGGGVEGLGRSEASTLGGQAADTGIGAGVGAGTGLAGATAAQVGGRLLEPLKRRFFEGGDRTARRGTGNVIEQGGSSPAEVMEQVDALPPGGVPADVPELTMLAREMAPRDAAQKLLTERLEGQGGSVMDVVDDVASRSGVNAREYNRSARAVADAQRGAAKGQYDAVYSRPDIPSEERPALAAMLEERPSLKSAYEAARKSSLDQGKPLPKLLDMHGSVDPEDWTWKETPGWREWDHIQRGLRLDADKAARGAAVGNVPGNQARVLRDLRREVTTELDDLAPEFGVARQTYAGFQAVRDAMDTGRTLLKSTVDYDDFAEAFADMSQSEKLGIQVGLFKNLRNVMDNKRVRSDLAATMISKPAERMKLSLVLGDEGAQHIVDVLQDTSQKIGASRLVTSGSATAPQQAVREAFRGGAGGGPMEDLLQGNPGNAMRSAIRDLSANPGDNPAVRAQVGAAMMDPEKYRQMMTQRQALPQGLLNQMSLPQPGTAALWGGLGGGIVADELFNRPPQ